MLKAVSTIVTITSVATAQYNQYGYGQPAPQQNYGNQKQYGNQYGNQYGVRSYRSAAHSFHKPGPLINPKYYKSILSNFKKCRQHKCGSLGRGYSTDIKKSISIVGAYTSCVTACAADEAFRVIQDLKSNLAKLNDIGFAQLVIARKYLGGQSDYDVIGNCTRIDDSCCLPESYFVGWDRLMIPVSVAAIDTDHKVETVLTPGAKAVSADNVPRMVSVDSYLKKCTVGADDLDIEWLDHIRFNCDPDTVRYLELIQHNVGHLVLAPKCTNLAPDNACNKEKHDNPRATEFREDMCVARFCALNGKTQAIDIPLVKPTIPAEKWEDSCPSDTTVRVTGTGDDETIKIQYERIPRAHLLYFTVTKGFPSASIASADVLAAAANGTLDEVSCVYDQGLAVADSDDFFNAVTFNASLIEAAKVCPYQGLYEYCNMDQYASYLQRQLFDNDDCQVLDMRDSGSDLPQFYGTLACLYKITALKCDCMQAVLNCYEHEYHFSEALAQTIGKAASILCGFLLCQRPSVYALFGGQGSIEKARIMRELMSQVGLSVPSMASMPPATFAFLSFGLGMVAFVTTKYIALSLIHI